MQPFDLTPDGLGDAVFDKMNLVHRHVESFGYLRGRPVLVQVKVEDLELLRLNVPLHLDDGRRAGKAATIGPGCLAGLDDLPHAWFTVRQHHAIERVR